MQRRRIYGRFSVLRRRIMCTLFENAAEIIIIGKSELFRDVFQRHAFDDIIFRLPHFFVDDEFQDAFSHFPFEQRRAIYGGEKDALADVVERNFLFDVHLDIIFDFYGERTEFSDREALSDLQNNTLQKQIETFEVVHVRHVGINFPAGGKEQPKFVVDAVLHVGGKSGRRIGMKVEADVIAVGDVFSFPIAVRGEIDNVPRVQDAFLAVDDIFHLTAEEEGQFAEIDLRLPDIVGMVK